MTYCDFGNICNVYIRILNVDSFFGIVYLLPFPLDGSLSRRGRTDGHTLFIQIFLISILIQRSSPIAHVWTNVKHFSPDFFRVFEFVHVVVWQQFSAHPKDSFKKSLSFFTFSFYFAIQMPLDICLLARIVIHITLSKYILFFFCIKWLHLNKIICNSIKRRKERCEP